jgi:hypothetical protein
MATASDRDGSVSRVEFYAGATLVGTDTTSPYSVVWPNPSPGTYSLTAKAYDNPNASTVSASVAFTVSSGSTNTPPAVTISVPANDAIFAPSTTIQIRARDKESAITRVEFFAGSARIARRTITRELAVAALRIELKAGSCEAQTVAPGMVRFDDVGAARQ